jgi:uncharacterized protein
MKNAIILHGTGCTPDSFWQPSIKAFLEKKGYSVWVPQLPDADTPDLKKWLPMVMDTGEFNQDTILIGHSAGGPLVLSVLENLSTTIHKAILVAGYARQINKPELILQETYDWKKIKDNVRDLIFLNSSNDPWGCDHKEGLYMWNKLGGSLVLLENEGHMGSDSYNQPFTRFKLLEKLLELEYSRSSIDGSDKE